MTITLFLDYDTLRKSSGVAIELPIMNEKSDSESKQTSDRQVLFLDFDALRNSSSVAIGIT